MDHEAGVRPPERRGKQDLLRAALPRGKLRPARAAARTARAGAGLRGGPRPRSENPGYRRRGRVGSAGSVAAVAHAIPRADFDLIKTVSVRPRESGDPGDHKRVHARLQRAMHSSVSKVPASARTNGI